MGELKKCPVDLMAYLKELPKNRLFLDDMAQHVWMWGEDDTSEYEFVNDRPFPMSYRVFLAHRRRHA